MTRLDGKCKPMVIRGQEIYPIDCLEGFEYLDDGSIDHVSTSPPYNVGGFHADGKERKYAGGFTDDMAEGEYRDFIKKVMKECYRVLDPEGSFFLNMKTRIANGVSIPPFWVLEDNPFHLKQEIIWHYPSTANVDKVRFYPLFEYVFWFVKDVKGFTFNSEWAVIGNVWNISHVTDRNETKIDVGGNAVQHPAPFPTQLSQAMILSTTREGDTVLDPFLGSGTTLKVARKYKRNGIGFEKYFSHYEPVIRARIDSTAFPRSLLDEKRDKKKARRKPNRTLDGFIAPEA